MHLSNNLLPKPEIVKDYFYEASAVTPNAYHQDTRAPLFAIDHVAKQLSNAAQTLEAQYCEEPESQQLFHDCLTQVWHRDIRIFASRLEEYSNEAVMAPIQYSETLPATKLQNQDDFSPDFEGKDDDSCLALQNATKPPIIFLEHFLTVQPSTGHLKCAMICYTCFLESGLFIIRIRLCIIDGNGFFIIEGKGCQFFPPFCFWPFFVIHIPIFFSIIYNWDVDYK
jgi:hypothetical protein